MKELISRAVAKLRRMMGKTSVNDMTVETRSWSDADGFLADDTVPDYIREEFRRRQEQAKKLAPVVIQD